MILLNYLQNTFIRKKKKKKSDEQGMTFFLITNYFLSFLENTFINLTH